MALQLEMCGIPFAMARIQTEAELRHELETQPPDLVLSDHGLPAFSGFRALQIVREGHPDLPFIFVSGSNDQGMVAKMYEEGATDYVFKQDLDDLKSAVLRALEPPPDAAAPAAETEATPPQQEREPQLAVSSAAAPAASTGVGQLQFCPACHQARDEHGMPVRMEDYCGTHAEIIVIRRLCLECERLNSALYFSAGRVCQRVEGCIACF